MKKTFKHNKFTAEFTDEGGYFSLTGDVNGSSGAVSDYIAKIDKRFKLLDHMHLASCTTGQPSFCLENGYYQYKNAKPKTYPSKFKALEDYCKIKLTKGDKDAIVFAGSRKEKDVIRDIIGRHEKEYLQKIKDVYNLVESIPSDLREPKGWYKEEDVDDLYERYDNPDKVIALARHLDCNPNIIEDVSDEEFIGEGIHYYVLTDDEANKRWDDYLESCMDECLEIPDSIKACFDRDGWKEDAKIDGRGVLSGYDGIEEESDGYYIYRC